MLFRFGIAVRLWLVPAGDTPGHAQATDLLAAQDPALVQAARADDPQAAHDQRWHYLFHPG